MEQVNLKVDAAQAFAAISEVEAAIAASPPWLRWLASHALQGLKESIHFSVDGGLRPTQEGAHDLLVVAQPTDGLRQLLASVRAGNGQEDDAPQKGLIDKEVSFNELQRRGLIPAEFTFESWTEATSFARRARPGTLP